MGSASAGHIVTSSDCLGNEAVRYNGDASIPLSLSPGAIGEEGIAMGSGLFRVFAGVSPDKRFSSRYNDREQHRIRLVKRRLLSLGDLIRP